MPIDELKGIKAVESIDLSGKKLGYMSAIIIGACIAGNAHLRKLKCALPSEPCMQSGTEGHAAPLLLLLTPPAAKRALVPALLPFGHLRRAPRADC